MKILFLLSVVSCLLSVSVNAEMPTPTKTAGDCTGDFKMPVQWRRFHVDAQGVTTVIAEWRSNDKWMVTLSKGEDFQTRLFVTDINLQEGQTLPSPDLKMACDIKGDLSFTNSTFPAPGYRSYEIKGLLSPDFKSVRLIGFHAGFLTALSPVSGAFNAMEGTSLSSTDFVKLNCDR
jgi:hypothetical protein